MRSATCYMNGVHCLKTCVPKVLQIALPLMKQEANSNHPTLCARPSQKTPRDQAEVADEVPKVIRPDVQSRPHRIPKLHSCLILPHSKALALPGHRRRHRPPNGPVLGAVNYANAKSKTDSPQKSHILVFNPS